MLALVEEVGRDTFIASLRKSLEDIEVEARRRIAELPDGTFRVNLFSELHSAREHPAEEPVRHHGEGRRADHRLERRRAADPNRAFNSTLGTAKCGMNQAFLGFFWPDLPRGISVMNPSRS